MQRIVSIVLATGVALMAGCTPRADNSGPGPAAQAQGLPTGASGKMGADQAGALSPVPAFRAVGADWRLQAEGVEGMRLTAHLQRDGGGEDNATLLYDPARAMASPRTHVLSGTLYGDGGDRPIEVTLVRERCANAEGGHDWRVALRIGGGAPMAGCADVAI